ncbi:hypothetical protein PFICI_14826 [Pestalotiopsis fici W106-1]|uniref:Uncharacterized protein n=1 Tax=Pestalotiopsis fici (strain W106-1 / CGMCC3.15140) TaxID=1229662 RepID=W3WIX5_PESFW|nr:uncharacterized protein PFICI_14826 [Pestalotiopsis fici W106-1]ETS73880.1 hypothetical protein PFICI_14826 [Pestalotiopsis fici W106-1]
MTSLYDVSVPIIRESLQTASSILRKGVKHAQANNISDADLLGARIYTDMVPLPNQILILHRVTERFIEKVAGRPTSTDLTGVLSPYEGNVQHLFDLLDEAIRDLDAVARESVDGKEDFEFTFDLATQIRKATGANYVHRYVVPYSMSFQPCVAH